MRIRTHLILMALAVLVPVVLAAYIALDKVRDGERQAALRGLRETVRATALAVDREVQGSISAMQVLGNSELLETGDLQGFYGKAAALDQGSDVWTLLFDASGNQVLNTALPFGTPVSAQAENAGVARTLAMQRPVISDLRIGRATGRTVTTVYVPARAGGGHKYVVAQAFAVGHWTRTTLQPLHGLDGWVVAVIDREGRFVARSQRTDELLGKPARPELVAAAGAVNDGLVRHRTLEGMDAYDAFTHSALTGWTVAVAAPVESIEASAAHAVVWLSTSMLLALVAAGLAAAVLGQRFMMAIDTSSIAARALGRGEQPAPPRTLLREVNALNDALRGAGELLRVERESRHLAEAERERLLQSETAAREDAQAQNLAKDQFLAMLGHELRNPLAAISGATSLLALGGVDKEREGRYLDIIRRQNRHLGHIVNDLLDVSRLLAGKIQLEKAPLDLAACVADSVDALRATERAIGYRLAVDAPEPVWINGDAVRIEQVVNNLITNALKYSPVGSEVRVAVRAERDRAVVEVRDAGSGMTAQLLAHIFEPFMQGPPPANRLQSGLGIGLALVRQLVALHGGEVHAFSEGLGKGSVFTVTLPLARQPAATAQPLAPGAHTACRVLLVEDNADARASMADYLRLIGYDVLEAGDGDEALRAAAEGEPAVIVMDIGLPGRSGYEVAAALRADPRTASIPLAALTGYGQESDRKRSAEAGFDEHLVKPIHPQQLADTIDRLARQDPIAGRAAPRHGSDGT